MKLNALSLSLCRVPAFGTYDELPTAWPILKAKIKTASPSFYEQIDEVEANEIDMYSNTSIYLQLLNGAILLLPL